MVGLKMAKYKGSGWHFQTTRHSNARKYGKAGGSYARLTPAQKFPNIDNVAREDKIAFLMKSGLFKKETLMSFDDKKLDELTVAGLEATGYKKHFGEAEKGETAGQVLERLSKSDTSSEQDSKIMQAVLRQTGLYPNAVVVMGVVYLDGHGTMQNPPQSIHSVAKMILKAVEQAKKGKHYGKPQPEISTIYGKGKYSHTEDDKEFYSHNGDPYSYKNGYAVIHTGNAHHIYVLEPEEKTKHYGASRTLRYQVGRDYIINNIIYDVVASSTENKKFLLDKINKEKYDNPIIRKDGNTYALLVPVAPSLNHPRFHEAIKKTKFNWQKIRG